MLFVKVETPSASQFPSCFAAQRSDIDSLLEIKAELSQSVLTEDSSTERFRSTMVFLIVGRLLLFTLLLRGTEENEERFGEFCLRISDDSEPDPQPTPKSVQTNQPAKLSRRKPLKPNTDSTLPPDLNIQDDPEEVVMGDYDDIPDDIPVRPLSVVPRHGFSGCRCTAEKMKQPNEISKVLSSTRFFPTETCNSIEYIETLADGRMVCVTPFSLLTYFNNLMSFWSEPEAELPGETLKDGTEKTQQENVQIHPHPPGSSLEVEDEVHYTDSIKYIPACKLSSSFLIRSSEERTVESLFVEMQPFPCDVQIEVNMNDSSRIFLDLLHFEEQLQDWKISLPHEDDADSAPKNTAGCRCREEAKKLVNETSPIASARIWPPSEECSSTEFIEKLEDGREVCVAASSISAYLKTLREKRLLEAKDPGQKHSPPLKPAIKVSYDEQRALEFTDRSGPPQRRPCRACISSTEWTNFNPNDLLLLDMSLTSPGCPAIIVMLLTDGRDFCATSSDPWFRDLMEKLDIN